MSNKLKVLHVIPGVAPRYGGPSYVIVGMGRALGRAGVDVLVVTTDADGPGRLPCEYGKIVDYQGVPTIFFPRQLSEAFKYSRPLGQWVAAHCHDFDVVHIHAVYSHSSLAAASACRRAGVPYVVRPLGSLDPWSLRQKRWLKRILWHTSVKQMLQGAAAIHYTATEEKRLAETGLGLAHGVVIPIGVIIDPTLDDEQLTAIRHQTLSLGDLPYVLVLSRLHHKKGIELVIEAFVAATRDESLQAWHLVIAGDGEADYVQSLRALVLSRGASDRVVFAGWLTGAAKTSILLGASLFAMTSYQENFGLSAVEAMALGVPVLVSDRVNIASEIEAADAGWVVPLEPEKIVRSLRCALSDGDSRRRKGKAAAALVMARFSEDEVARQLTQLYATLAQRKPLGSFEQRRDATISPESTHYDTP